MIMRELPKEKRGSVVNVLPRLWVPDGTNALPVGKLCSVKKQDDPICTVRFSVVFRMGMRIIWTGIFKPYGIVGDNRMRRKISIWIPSKYRSIMQGKGCIWVLRTITVLSLPIRTIESEQFRRFSRNDFKISIEHHKNVLLQVFELVEVAIGKEMSNTKGADIHDACSNSGVQYIRIFASYMGRQKLWEGNNQIEVREHVILLLSMSSIMTTDEDDQNFEEAIKFCAKIQWTNIREVFSFYKADLGLCSVCLIQYDASVNVRIATLL